MRRIPALDGLRGLSVLLVVWDHFPAVLTARWIRDTAWELQPGPFGVTIFFVLSGFLITRILLNEKRSGTLSFKTFYLKRALRIFPIYYLALLVIGFSMTWRHSGWLALYMGNFLFAFDGEPHPLRHVWSLAVEEHFYLAWPALLGWLPIRWSRTLVMWVLPACAIGMALLLCNLLSHGAADALIYRGTFCQMLPLCAGAAFAFAEPTVVGVGSRSKALLIAGMPLFWTLGALATDIHLPPLLISAYTIKLICFTLSASCAVLIGLNCGGSGSGSRIIAFVLTSRVLTFLGTISYGIYLYHYPILSALGLMRENAIIGPAAAIAVLGSIFVLPTLSWYALESPILQWKDRLVRSRHALAPSP